MSRVYAKTLQSSKTQQEKGDLYIIPRGNIKIGKAYSSNINIKSLQLYVPYNSEIYLSIKVEP